MGRFDSLRPLDDGKRRSLHDRKTDRKLT